MARKIIQIAVSVLPWLREEDVCEGRTVMVQDFEETLFALADDGTVWYTINKSPTLHEGWSRSPLPALPQGEVREATES